MNRVFLTRWVGCTHGPSLPRCTCRLRSLDCSFSACPPRPWEHAGKESTVDKMELSLCIWGTELEFVLVLHGPNLSDCTVSTEEPRLTVLANERKEHELPLCPDAGRTGMRRGRQILTLTDERGRTTPSPSIHDARLRPVGGQGIESGSTLYLIMPDRSPTATRRTTPWKVARTGHRPQAMYARHGGDLQGIPARGLPGCARGGCLVAQPRPAQRPAQGELSRLCRDRPLSGRPQAGRQCRLPEHGLRLSRKGHPGHSGCHLQPLGPQPLDGP